MRNIFTSTLFLLGFLIATSLPAFCQQDPVVQKIIELGKTDNQTMHHLDVLVNRIGGRPVGSDNYETAVKWAKKEFEEWGMDVVLHQTGVLPIGFNRGPWSGRLLGGETCSVALDFATPSYTVGTKGVQRGHVLIEPKTQREFDLMKSKLNGAWVLISGKSTGFPIDFSPEADAIRDSIILFNAQIAHKNSEINTYNADPKNKGKRKALLEKKDEPALFYKQMVEAGILGIIQSSAVPISALYDRKNLNNMNWDNLPKVPDIKLNEHQFAQVEQMAKERQYFQLEFEIRNNFRLGTIPYYSVIGIIKGSEFPDEYVVMGGHLDSYDVSTGASDNGAGVAPALEAARLIIKAGGKPKRSILVGLWSGEEFGLLGSSAWVKDNQDKLKNISAMFNRDGGPTVPISLAVPPAMLPDLERICAPISKINPEFPFSVNSSSPRTKPVVAGGTDTAPFLMAGVPVIDLRTEDVKGYNFSYREIWHTTRDTYDKCPPDYMNHSSIVTALIVYGVANLDHLLPRDRYFKK